MFFIGGLVIASFVFYDVGKGRWECAEEKTTCVNYINDDGIMSYLKYKGIESKDFYYCNEYKTECTKKVWTYYPTINND